jgi:hypothetical protein
MSSEQENNDRAEVINLKRLDLHQPASNTQAYSSTIYPSVQTYPSNTFHPNNMYPNQNPQIIMLNDGTRDTCSSIGCSVFNLIFCFFWLGIPAVILSCRANDNVIAGRLAEAQSDAKIAKILNIVGIVLGSVAVLAVTIYLIVYFVSLRYSYPFIG